MNVLEVESTRRNLLKAGMLLGASTFLGSCTNQLSSEVVESNKKPTPKPTNGEILLSDFNQEYFRERAKSAFLDFARFYKLDIDTKEISQQVFIINSKEDFLEYFPGDGQYREGDELRDLYLVNREPGSAGIYINKIALEELIGKEVVPGEVADICDYALMLGLSSYLCAKYESIELTKVVSLPVFYGRFIESSVTVEGAKIKFRQKDGSNIEVVEFIDVIEENLIAQNAYFGSEKETPLDLNFKITRADVLLYIHLLSEVFESKNRDEILARLLEMRMKKGGREEFLKNIQKVANKDSFQVSIFPFSVFGAISEGDKAKYRELMGFWEKSDF